MLIISRSKLNNLYLFASLFCTFLKMKKIVIFVFLVFILLGCSKDRARNNNPFIPSYPFSVTLNLNLPQFQGLATNLNPISYTEPSGIAMLLMKVSDTEYHAWNAYCPSQYPSSCSLMTLNGLEAKCGCDIYKYSMFTGVGNAPYAMVAYRIEILGNNTLRVYN